MNVRKRVSVVSVKAVKESSFLYDPRRITCAQDAVELGRRFLSDSDREMFLVVTLSTKNEPTSVNICSVGSLNASIVHPREVYKIAILSNAASVLFVHNHPSGNLEPSKEDIQITKRLKDAGEILGIKVLDHLIVSSDESGRYYSFKEHEKI